MTPQEAEAVLSQPSREEVEQLLRADVLRQYRIDIETDSTIRADLTRSQQTMAQFVEGAGTFLTGIAPAVQGGMVPIDIAAEIFSAFARQFKLGKQAEDALDRLAQHGKMMAQQPPPPNPEAEKVALEREKAAAEQQAKEKELALKEAEAQRQHELAMAQERAKVEAEQIKAQEAEAQRRHATELKALELLATREAKREEMTVQGNLEREKLGATVDLEREKLATTKEVEDAKLQDAKEGRTAERKDKIAERTGKMPDDIVETDRVAEESEKLGGSLSELGGVVKDLAALIKQNAEQMADLKKILLSPAVVERDKKTGRVTGARRVVN